MATGGLDPGESEEGMVTINLSGFCGGLADEVRFALQPVVRFLCGVEPFGVGGNRNGVV